MKKHVAGLVISSAMAGGGITTAGIGTYEAYNSLHPKEKPKTEAQIDAANVRTQTAIGEIISGGVFALVGGVYTAANLGEANFQEQISSSRPHPSPTQTHTEAVATRRGGEKKKRGNTSDTPGTAESGATPHATKAQTRDKGSQSERM